MGSDDLLVMAMALPPMWLSAKLWWSTRHAVDELRESCAFRSGAARATDGGRSGAPDGDPGLEAWR